MPKTLSKEKSIYDIAIKTIWIVFIGFAIYFILFSDIKQLILFIPDDSSYYLKIAENYNKGYGFSFDGMHTTNGFQPLWQYISILFLFFIKSTPENTIKVILLLQVIITLLSSVLFYKTLENRFSKKSILLGTACYLAFVLPQSINGMETPILVFSIAILFYFAQKQKLFIAYNPKNEYIFGVLLSLVLLARLDSIFFIIPVYVLLLWQVCSSKNKKLDIIRTCAISIGIATFFIPYLVYNIYYFGHAVPISGYLKSNFPEISIYGKIHDLISHRESCFIIIAPIYLFYFFLFRQKKQLNDFYSVFLSIMAGGVCLLFSYHFLFMRWMYFSWYFVPYSLFFAIVMIYFAQIFFIKSDNKYTHYISAIFTLVIIGYRIQNYIIYYNYQNNWSLKAYDASQWVKNNTSNEAVFAMTDAGHFSFFSERNVINLDGLVNNFNFQDIIHQKKLKEYMAENKVKYIAQHSIWNHQEIADGQYDFYNFTCYSKLHATVSDSLVLKKDDEVYHSSPYEDAGNKVAFIIWDISSAK